MQTPRTNRAKGKETENAAGRHSKAERGIEGRAILYVVAFLSFVSIILDFITRDVKILFTLVIGGTATLVVWRYFFRS